MKSFYLIDFENIGTSGIENALYLASDSNVILFSTKKAAKINALPKYTTEEQKQLAQTIAIE